MRLNTLIRKYGRLCPRLCHFGIVARHSRRPCDFSMRQCHFGKVAGQSRELGENLSNGSEELYFRATLTATLTKCQCRMAFSQGIPDKWVFPLSFLIFIQTLLSLSSRFSLLIWAILRHNVLISKSFSESIATQATIVGRVIIIFFAKLHHHCW